MIRATSLSGIANRYIALTPGANSAPELPDGSVLTSEQTTAPVDLDQLFNTLDPKARKSLQQVIQGSAAQYQGKGKEANVSAKYFNPAISTTARLVNEITNDQKVFTEFLDLELEGRHDARRQAHRALRAWSGTPTRPRPPSVTSARASNVPWSSCPARCAGRTRPS